MDCAENWRDTTVLAGVDGEFVKGTASGTVIGIDDDQASVVAEKLVFLERGEPVAGSFARDLWPTANVSRRVCVASPIDGGNKCGGVDYPEVRARDSAAVAGLRLVPKSVSKTKAT